MGLVDSRMASRLLILLVGLGLLAGCKTSGDSGPQAARKPWQRPVTTEYAEESARLTREGNEAIDDGDLETAEKRAAQLKDRGYIGAWELRARLHTAHEEHEQALKVLDEGLALVDDHWVLWVQRGNTLSDLKRWEESAESYSKGRVLGGNKADIDFNEGLMRLRQGAHAKALPLFKGALASEESALRDRAAQDAAVCLAALKRVSEIATWLKPFEPEVQSQAWIEVADYYLEVKDKPKALEAALTAARLHRKNEDALWYVREADLRYSKKAHHWQLVVSGSRDGTPFTTGYRVLAESPEQGLELARRLETSGTKIQVIDEKTRGERDSKNPLGVYKRFGFAFYDDGPDGASK